MIGRCHPPTRLVHARTRAELALLLARSDGPRTPRSSCCVMRTRCCAETISARPEPDVVGCWVSTAGASGSPSTATGTGRHDGPRGDDQSGLACVAVARRHKPQRLSVCGYLVDTYRLGLKNTLGPDVMNDRDQPTFLRMFFSAIEPDGTPQETSIEHARLTCRARTRTACAASWNGDVAAPDHVAAAADRSVAPLGPVDIDQHDGDPLLGPPHRWGVVAAGPRPTTQRVCPASSSLLSQLRKAVSAPNPPQRAHTPDA
jgi:hypothetical protein